MTDRRHTQPAPPIPTQADLPVTRTDATAIVVLALAVILRWWRVLPGVGDWHFEAGDFVDQFYAFAHFEVAQLAAGKLPLWNPHAFAGSPFWADIQAAVAYPPSLVIALAAAWTRGSLPYRALELEAVGHVLLAALGTYLFARRLFGRRGPALIAALAFGLGGWVNGYPPLQLAVLEAAAWLPFALWGVARTVDRPSAWPLPALALGMCVLAGHPQTTLYVGYATVAWAAWLLWRAEKTVRARRSEQSGPSSWANSSMSFLRHARSRLIALAAAAIGALGLSAAGWLPAAAYLRLSNRAEAGYDMLAHGFPAGELLGVVLPGITKWAPLYIGLVPLWLALMAMWWTLFGQRESRADESGAAEDVSRPPTDNIFWIGLALIALLLSLGRNGILFDLFYHLAPGFDLFRGQERAAMLASFALAMLAGAGYGLIVEVPWLAERVKARSTGNGSSTAPTLTLAADEVWLRRFSNIGAWIMGSFVLFFIVLITATLGLDITPSPNGPRGWSWFHYALVALFWVWVLSIVPRPKTDLRLRWMLPPFIAASLLHPVLFDTTNLTRTPPPELTRAPAQMILSQAGLTGRVHDHPDRWERRWPLNAGMLHGYASLDGASPLRLRTYDALREAVAVAEDERRLWELLAVSHVVSGREEIAGTSKLIALDDGSSLFALDAPWPRAWRAPGAETVDDATAAARLADEGWDPMSVVLLAEEEAGVVGDGSGEGQAQAERSQGSGDEPAETTDALGNSGAGTLTTVEIPGPGEVHVRTEGPAPAWIVFSEIHDPAWRATLDGQETLVHRADLGLMAVAVPAGSHELRLRYRPRSVPIGLGLSLVSALALVATLAGGRAMGSAESTGWPAARMRRRDRLTRSRRGATPAAVAPVAMLMATVALSLVFAGCRPPTAQPEQSTEALDGTPDSVAAAETMTPGEADPVDRGPAETTPSRGAYPRPAQTATAIFGYPGFDPVTQSTRRAPARGYPRPGGSDEVRGRATPPAQPPYPPPARSGRDLQRARFPIVLVGPGPDAGAAAGAPDPMPPEESSSPGPSTASTSASAPAARPTGPCAGIVQREGERLTLDGQPFAFFGTNVQYLLDDELPEERVEPMVAELAAKGAAVLRVWYLPKHDAQRFGRLLEIGRRHGVRFVVALEDNVFHGRDWFGSEDDRERYRPHLERTVERHRESPEILMWELINEPNCGERYDTDCLDTIKGWLRGRAREVEAVDACHLVTTGMIGAGNYEQDLSMYRRTHRTEEIDVLSMHKRVGETWEKEMSAAAELERPILLGEVYDRAYAKDCSPLEGGNVRDRRAERVVDELRDALAAGVDGYLLWAHAAGAVEQPNGTLRHFCGEFDYEIDDPLWDHLADRDGLPPPVPWGAAP